jgi:DNA-binding transcriptional ArsR family regulator
MQAQYSTLETADRLHSAAIHLLRGLRKRDRESGIGPAQLSALSVLAFGGPRSLAELADAEQVRPPTMSRIVAALERAGLVHISKPVPGGWSRWPGRWLHCLSFGSSSYGMLRK